MPGGVSAPVRVPANLAGVQAILWAGCELEPRAHRRRGSCRGGRGRRVEGLAHGELAEVLPAQAVRSAMLLRAMGIVILAAAIALVVVLPVVMT